MESGSPVYMIAENNTQNQAFTQRLAEMVGCASPTFTIKDYLGPVVECLKNVDAVLLAEADHNLEPHASSSFLPQYGDEIIPSNPRNAIINGDFQCTELLVGNNKDEGSFRLTTANPEMFGFFGEKNTLFNKSEGEDFLREAFKDFPDLEYVVQHYFSETVPEEASALVRNLTYTSFGDIVISCPVVYHAEKCTQKRGKVYYYFWTHQPSNTPWAEWMGAAHFSEVQFVFGSPLLNPTNYTKEERRMSRQMIEIWSSFAKDGKPSTPWPLYSKEKPLVKFLGPEFETEDDVGTFSNNCDFLRPFFTTRKK